MNNFYLNTLYPIFISMLIVLSLLIDELNVILLASILSFFYYLFFLLNSSNRSLILRVYVVSSMLRLSICGFYISIVIAFGDIHFISLPFTFKDVNNINIVFLFLTLSDFIFIVILNKFNFVDKGMLTKLETLVVSEKKLILTMSTSILLVFLNDIVGSKLISVFSDFLFPSVFLYILFNWRVQSRLLLFICSLVFGFHLLHVTTSYMKQPLLILLLPVIIFVFVKLLTSRRAILNVTFFVISLFFFSALFNNYSSERRAAFWTGNDIAAESSIPVIPFIVTAIEKTFSFSSNEPTQYNAGIWKLFHRVQLISASTWAYEETLQGRYQSNFISDALYMLIPRIVFPEKAIIWPGRELAVTLGQASNAEDATSSTALGLQGAYIRSFGLYALPFCVFFSAWLLAKISNNIECSNQFGFVNITLTLYLTLECIRWFEGSFSGGLDILIKLFIIERTLFLFLPLLNFNRHYK